MQRTDKVSTASVLVHPPTWSINPLKDNGHPLTFPVVHLNGLDRLVDLIVLALNDEAHRGSASSEFGFGRYHALTGVRADLNLHNKRGSHDLPDIVFHRFKHDSDHDTCWSMLDPEERLRKGYLGKFHDDAAYLPIWLDPFRVSCKAADRDIVVTPLNLNLLLEAARWEQWGGRFYLGGTFKLTRKSKFTSTSRRGEKAPAQSTDAAMGAGNRVVSQKRRVRNNRGISRLHQSRELG